MDGGAADGEDLHQLSDGVLAGGVYADQLRPLAGNQLGFLDAETAQLLREHHRAQLRARMKAGPGARSRELVMGKSCQFKPGGAGGARTHDRRIMRSTALCIVRTTCTDTTEPCRRWP